MLVVRHETVWSTGSLEEYANVVWYSDKVHMTYLDAVLN